MYRHLLVGLIFLLVTIKLSNEVIFSVRPGDGKEFVYSPVDVNATIHCAVNASLLSWQINSTLSLSNDVQRPQLNSKGIFENGPRTDSSGVTESSVTIFGDEIINNNTEICCQTAVNTFIAQNCTTLITYDRPFPPQRVSLRQSSDLYFNISWMAIIQTGVEHNYTVNFGSYKVETAELYLIHQLSTLATQCSIFLAYVRAVNGAGESDPSNNVTIPSLPDIEPVTASLTHQVWKSNGQIMVNVSFQPGGYCKEYPIVSYMLIVRSQQTGALLVNLYLAVNETKAVLDELERDQKYLYSVSATNEIGLFTLSEGKSLVTIDVHTVQATVRDTMIELVCEFIYGSDALGCMIVLNSNCNTLSDKYATLSRNGTSPKTITQLHIPRNVSCFHRVFAHDINLNSTVSNLSIEGRVYCQSPIDNTHTGDTQTQVLAMVVPTVSVLFIVIITIIIASIVYITRKRTKRFTVVTCSECKSISPTNVMPQNATLTVQPSITTTPNAQVQNPQNTTNQEPSPTYATVTRASAESSMKENYAYNVGRGVSVIQSETIPIYALPEQLKHNESTDQTLKSVPTEKDKDSYNTLNSTNDHVYHVLESEKDTKKEEATPHKYESPKILRADMSSVAPLPGPVYQDISVISAKTKGDTESSIPHKHRSDPDGKETAISKDTAKNDSEDFIDVSQRSAGTSSVSTK